MAEQNTDNSQRFESFSRMFEGQSKPAQRETFQSFKQERAGSMQSSTGNVEEEIHMEATQVAAQ